MTVFEFLKATEIREQPHMPRPRVICADGFEVSIQHGYGNYCNI